MILDRSNTTRLHKMKLEPSIKLVIFLGVVCFVSPIVVSFQTHEGHQTRLVKSRKSSMHMETSSFLYNKKKIPLYVSALPSSDQEASSSSPSEQTDEVSSPDIEKSSISRDHPSSSATPTTNKLRCIKAVAPRTCPLNEAVASIADVSFQDANELIRIGAVWARMETLTEEDVLRQYDEMGTGFSATSVEYADLPRGWGSGGTTFTDYSFDDDDDEGGDLDAYIEKMQSQRYRRILTPSLIEAGTDIRVYPQPRRFPACYDMTPDRLLYEDTTFIVVDKPPMLPTQPDTSNYFECCPGCTSDLMGPFYDIEQNKIARPLLCHRVDSCVGGCVVMSKDPNGQRVFNELQRNRKLKKVYLAVTNNPVPVGMHICWFWKPANERGSTGGPPCQLVSFKPPESRRKSRQFWVRCVLEVVKCEPIEITKSGEHTYDPGDKQHFQSTIRLVTGRKHQVRAQLASLGSPIIRDTLYQPIAGLTLDVIMSGGGYGSVEDEDAKSAAIDEALSRCKVPTEPIGLQAHAILFGGIRAKAKTPWWGDGRGNKL